MILLAKLTVSALLLGLAYVLIMQGSSSAFDLGVGFGIMSLCHWVLWPVTKGVKNEDTK